MNGTVVRSAAVALGVAMLVFAGCSDDDGGLQGSSGSATTDAIVTSTTSTTSTGAAGVSTTSPVPASSASTTIARALTTTASPGTAAPTVTTAVAAGPAVAEAGGWRLVVSQPTARATIPPAAVVCYEATGSSREPELELEVTALPPGTTVRVGVQVGRGAARVDLAAAGAGARDLRIQLVVNGQRIDGLAVTVPVTIAAGTPPGTC
jgi:hypothetical protein